MIDLHNPIHLESIKKELIFENVFNYKPHEAQKKVHFFNNARFSLAICGRKFGKSTLAAKEAEYLFCNPYNTSPIDIIAPTYKIAGIIFDEIFRDVVEGYGNTPPLLTKSQLKKSSRSDHIIESKWGSVVNARSAEKPDNLRGFGSGFLIIDEAAFCKENIFKIVLPNSDMKQGKILLTTTPKGKNWIYDKYKLGMQKINGWESFHYPTAANPYFPREALEQARLELSAEAFSQEYEAQFITYQGKVYKDFNTEIHVINTLPTEYDDIICGIDYGFVAPTAILHIGIKNNIWYVFKELYKTGLLQYDIAKYLKQVEIENPNKKIKYYADHKPEYNEPIGKLIGNKIYNANKEVETGIEQVARKIKIINGTPQLYIYKDCANTIQELEEYQYIKVDNDKKISEIPAKINDHTCDALRYAITTHGNQFIAQKIKAG